MTSFYSIQSYSPLLVLAVGLATFVGIWGVGEALLRFVHLRLQPPWNQVTALLLGIQALSLAVQIVGMTETASPFILRAIWWIFVVIGSSMLLIHGRRIRAVLLLIPYPSALLPTAIIGLATTINAMVAMAPSSKIDELYYHMVIPSRIVTDGALRFYREPWEGAIWPQMVFQISAAPAHALGYPDSTNVVSWALSATLLWFAWYIVRANANKVPWTSFCVAVLCVGIYPAVWHVTGGAHAMGDLALTAAIVAFCNRERLLVTTTPPAYGTLISILLLSAATSKISLLPVCGVLLALAVYDLMKSAPKPARWRVALAVVAPWLLFYCPIAWWTWAHSGSPFGPVVPSVFESSVYSNARLQQIFQSTRDKNQMPLLMVRNAVLGYSPVIWLGVIGVLVGHNLQKSTRVSLGCLLMLQSILIYWLLPYDVRFLGIHYGLFIVFSSTGVYAIQERLTSVRVMFAACGLFLLPWLGLQIYFAKQFFPVFTRLEKENFYRQKVAYYSDYLKLNSILSKDTVLMVVPGLRISASYAPRPVFFDFADLPQGRPIALFALGETISNNTLFDGYKLGEVIYENPQAIVETFRTPGRVSVTGSLKVVRVIDKADEVGATKFKLGPMQ